MNVLSLFDGISCGQVALERAGIQVDNYYASEVDKYAIKVTQENYPDTIQLGDVTQWETWDIDWSSIDLLIGGSPCNSFSNSGNKKGFADSRGGLFYVYVDILNHIRKHNHDVKYLFENVRMKKEFHNEIINHLGESVYIDSRVVTPLSRPRYYYGNVLWQDRKFASDMPPCPMCEEPWCDLHRKHFHECDCIGATEEDDSIIMHPQEDFLAFRMPEQSTTTLKSVLEPNPTVGWLTQAAIERLKGINKRASEKNLGYYDCIIDVEDDNAIYLNLDANYYKGADGKRGVLKTDKGLRMLTPLEAERLQTLPDNYTKTLSNSQRYKALGNGWTVDVITHMLKNMEHQ